MSIQLSSNSNEALRLVINSRPTAVGQYRQAYLQYTDRVSALKSCEFNLRRIEARLKLKSAERKQLIELLEAELNPNRIEAYEANIELLDIDTEELIQSSKEIVEQIDDAQREALYCKQIMDDICNQTCIDFASISTEEFQSYMLEETKLYQARKLAAGFLSSSTGLSPVVTEALLELPEADRQEMLKLQTQILEQHNKTVYQLAENNLDLKQIKAKLTEGAKLELVKPPLRFSN